MTGLTSSGLLRRARSWVARRLHRAVAGRAEGGFILLESVIAISVITIVMGAVGTEFVGSLAETSHQRAQQSAVQLADATVEQIRSLAPSDLVTGRDSSAVTSQFTSTVAEIAPVRPWLDPSIMDQAVDTRAAAGSGIAAAVPTCGDTVLATTCQQTPGAVVYTVNQYLGRCSIVSDSSSCVATSTVPPGTTSTPYLRAVVAVTWNGPRCAKSDSGAETPCAYVTSTLISAASDPTFRINAAAYAPPSVVSPGDQSVVIGDVVSRQLAVQNSTGVPPFTWAVSAGSLPGGLSMSPTGLVSGTVTGAAGTYSSTVQVTDAFLRRGTQVVTWTVTPALTYDDPGPQASTTSTNVDLTLVPRDGEGAPYSFTDPTSSLPAGLTLTSAGVISGRPTTVRAYTVSIKLVDRSGTRSYTKPFTWTVTPPPLAVSVPPTQTSTLSTAIPSLQLSASGGSGPYKWSDTPRSLPLGLSLNTTTGLITGKPSTVGTSTVNISVSDGKTSTTATFTWTVMARPTVTSPGNQTNTAGSATSLQLATACPNTPCTYTFGGTPPSGLAISSAGLITGTVGTTVNVFKGITVVVQDAAGATATSAAFSWTVNAAPTMGSPGNQTTLRGAAVTLNVSPREAGGTGPYTFSATGLPTWLTISAAGVITGTAPVDANSTTPGVIVTVTDASNVTASSTAFTWNVTDLANSFTSQTAYRSSAVSRDLNSSSTGGTGPFSYTASGLPTWLTLDPNTGVISGTSPTVTANSSTKSTAIMVTETDSVGAAITTAPFYWYDTDIVWSAPSTYATSRGQTVIGYQASTYVRGGAATKTYSATGMPTGLTMSSTGAITGITSTSGVYNMVLTVTDSVGATVSTPVQWTVS